MTPSHHPAAQAIEKAFDELLRQHEFPTEHVLTFAAGFADQPLTDRTKNKLLSYAVVKSASPHADDHTRDKLRGLAKTMLEKGADPNYRAFPSNTERQSPSLLDIAHNGEDERMRKLLHDHKAHSGEFLDKQLTQRGPMATRHRRDGRGGSESGRGHF